MMRPRRESQVRSTVAGLFPPDSHSVAAAESFEAARHVRPGETILLADGDRLVEPGNGRRRAAKASCNRRIRPGPVTGREYLDEVPDKAGWQSAKGMGTDEKVRQRDDLP